MKGAIIGDIVGSVYEFKTIKQKEFKFIKPKCFITDDTILTCAISRASLQYFYDKDVDNFYNNCIKYLKEYGILYPGYGYGYNFDEWIKNGEEPYNSYGNGSAMRTSSVAYIADSLEEAELLAEMQAKCTHNHLEGIKGAKAITACIYLAKEGYSKDDIKKYIEDNYYKIDFKIRDIYKKYKYDITCQGSVPQAIECFLEGEDFEDAIRNAISLGGDADTLAAMTGSISEAFYGIPDNLKNKMYSFLPENIKKDIEIFYENVIKKNELKR